LDPVDARQGQEGINLRVDDEDGDEDEVEDDAIVGSGLLEEDCWVAAEERDYSIYSKDELNELLHKAQTHLWRAEFLYQDFLRFPD
jgi:hypothetical protein